MQLQNNKITENLYVFAVAFIVLLICSQCSPLYLTNQWTDPNIYFTIGRAMVEGKLPYVDLYDHKGPVIYYIHLLAAFVSDKSFIGVWLFEILSAFLSLYFSRKMAFLFVKKDNLYYLPLLAILIYTSSPFAAGDSAEELCLPFLMYNLYIGYKNVSNKTVPNMTEGLIIGICMSFIFWAKFTIVGFYLGIALFFFIV